MSLLTHLTLKELYESIGGIRTTYPVLVTFYCSEDHMRFNAAKNIWQDTAYFYYNQNNEKRMVHYSVSGFSDPNNSPGGKGSYTTLGTFNRIDVTSD
jgi:hypothetical protein